MYLLDTNIISELRKRDRANPGITRFFDRIAAQEEIAYLSVITIGELRRGVDIIQHRGDFGVFCINPRKGGFWKLMRRGLG
jgi:toxin FitB